MPSCSCLWPSLPFKPEGINLPVSQGSCNPIRASQAAQAAAGSCGRSGDGRGVGHTTHKAAASSYRGAREVRVREPVTGPDAMTGKREILVPTEPACDLALSNALPNQKGMHVRTEQPEASTPGSFSVAGEVAV